MRRFTFALAAMAASICLFGSKIVAAEESPQAILANYADIGQAMYEDSLSTAKDLAAAVQQLIDSPNESTLAAARSAWLAARFPYQQSEGLRFGNAIVDDWEGRVNAWPLDEGLIDYVASAYGDTSDENPLYTLNIIANSEIRIGPDVIDATTISKELLAGQLHEAQGVEANVAIGYHAIEFLLWGQDLNGTGPGAGTRPASDYDPVNCTGGNCDRRAQYLQAAADLLVADLAEMVANWTPDGAARQALEATDAQAGLATILTGIGSLSYGELAGERMKLGLILHDPEEEHDCFSDNTHNSHYADQVGMMALYTGRYVRTDGTIVDGAGLAAYARAHAPNSASQLEQRMQETLAAMVVMKAAADSGRMAYDQMLGADNPEGNRILQNVVDALVAQARAVEALVAELGLSVEIEGSDSLDSPETTVH